MLMNIRKEKEFVQAKVKQKEEWAWDKEAWGIKSDVGEGRIWGQGHRFSRAASLLKALL